MNDGTLKVAKIEDHRPQTLATHTISYVLDGFQITSVIETAAPIRQIVDKLKSIGAQPPAAKSPVGEMANDSAPVCEFHGSMKRSNHGGFYCPKKMGDGSYCKSKG
jgi:hypothetical protein